MDWVWDEAKAASNRRKHGVSFAAAALALKDPYALSEPDPHSDNNRWRTLCKLGPAMLFIVHTWPEAGAGRIISARRALLREWREYEG